MKLPDALDTPETAELTNPSAAAKLTHRSPATGPHATSCSSTARALLSPTHDHLPRTLLPRAGLLSGLSELELQLAEDQHTTTC